VSKQPKEIKQQQHVKIKHKGQQFISWFSSPQRLAYIHVVEVSHKGYGISLDPLLSHTYHQSNRWRVSTKHVRVIQTSWSFHKWLESFQETSSRLGARLQEQKIHQGARGPPSAQEHKKGIGFAFSHKESLHTWMLGLDLDSSRWESMLGREGEQKLLFGAGVKNITVGRWGGINTLRSGSATVTFETPEPPGAGYRNLRELVTSAGWLGNSPELPGKAQRFRDRSFQD
jgi:hypothetical protein